MIEPMAGTTKPSSSRLHTSELGPYQAIVREGQKFLQRPPGRVQSDLFIMCRGNRRRHPMSWLSHCLGTSRRPAPSSRRPTAARLRVEALEDRRTPTVLYYGGNLLPHVEAQAVFLGNEWSSVPADAAQTSTLNAFLKDLTGGAYVDALTRAGYNVGRGTASAGAIDARALTPGSTITDATIQADLSADITSGRVQAP